MVSNAILKKIKCAKCKRYTENSFSSFTFFEKDYDVIEISYIERVDVNFDWKIRTSELSH